MNRSIVAAVLLLAASPAAAARPDFATTSAPGPGGRSLSFWAVLDPGPVDGIGLGGRLTLPIVPEGVLHARVKDELTLELGADFVHYSDRVGYYPYYVNYSWNGFLAVVGGAWNFWFTPRFALYPKIDLGYWWGWYNGWNPNYGYGHPSYGGVFLQGAVGLIYRFQTVSLRAELGSGLFRIGLGVPF